MLGIRVYKNSEQNTNSSFPNSFFCVSYNIKYKDFTSEITYPLCLERKNRNVKKVKTLKQPKFVLGPWLTKI